MSKVTSGNIISVHYRGTLADGTEFDSSHNRGETLNFTVGSGQMISGFDAGVVGMQVGDTKSIQISADQGYGERVEEAIQEVPKTAFPQDFEFIIDGTVQGAGPDGRPVMAKILKENSETITLDFNHPLAGQALNFEIELVDIGTNKED
jgi:peptidylprolyl isomerase